MRTVFLILGASLVACAYFICSAVVEVHRIGAERGQPTMRMFVLPQPDEDQPVQPKTRT